MSTSTDFKNTLVFELCEKLKTAKDNNEAGRIFKLLYNKKVMDEHKKLVAEAVIYYGVKPLDNNLYFQTKALYDKLYAGKRPKENFMPNGNDKEFIKVVNDILGNKK